MQLGKFYEFGKCQLDEKKCDKKPLYSGLPLCQNCIKIVKIKGEKKC